MTQSLQLEQLLNTLVEDEVVFVIVDGCAVAAHGYVRATKGIDICPDPDPDNLRRLVDALDLHRMKRAAGRPQDLVDVNSLKAARSGA